MSLPSAAFSRNDPNLPHFEDVRRARGRYQTGGREDGTGYSNQRLQYPVICDVDIYERSPNDGREFDHVTTTPVATRCPGCRERLGLPWK